MTMGKRCPSCNKLVGLETQDPDDVELEISEGTISARFSVKRNSACCGDEMKEANFEPEKDISEHVKDHTQSEQILHGQQAIDRAEERDEKLEYGEEEISAEVARALLDGHPEREEQISLTVQHELSVEESSVELTERSEGRGRGCRSYYGALISYTVTCSCQDDAVYEGEISDECQASHFDELT
jgi:hypothetical protein